MTEFTNPMTVTFVLDHATITTTVSDFEADDWDFIVNQATSVLYDVYGIDAGILADQIIVTNTRGEELDET